jgi:polyphosphate kinase 2 (PPK2 family)
MKLEDYRIKRSIALKDFDTKEVIENAEKKLKKVSKKLAKIQDTMYAEGKYSLLICLQGMDTSGKDSLVR